MVRFLIDKTCILMWCLLEGGAYFDMHMNKSALCLLENGCNSRPGAYWRKYFIPINTVAVNRLEIKLIYLMERVIDHNRREKKSHPN